jgi:hypothetical protein
MPTAGPRNFMTAAARRFCSKTWRGFGTEPVTLQKTAATSVTYPNGNKINSSK